MTKRNIGAANGRAKLNEQKIVDIRFRYWVLEVSQKKLSEIHEISQQSISNIVNGKSWQHVRNYIPDEENSVGE